MVVISIEFVARRYHATPWGAHVNEGQIEWPPCPWRILRALIAVGYNKLGWSDGLPTTAKTLFEKLSQSAPAYSLPATWTETHTRHYMPVRDGKAEKKAKVFDAYLRFHEPNSELLVRFDVQLDSDERTALQQLVEALAYLGRAESWVEASLLSDREAKEQNETQEWCLPATDSTNDRTQLLSPVEADQYHEWREAAVATAGDRAERDAVRAAESKSKKASSATIKKARNKAAAQYPADLFTALQTDNSSWQSAGWPRPPGSHWVDYERPQPAAFSIATSFQANPNSLTSTDTLLLAIDGEGKQGNVRPLMKRALPLMELLHAEAVRQTDKLDLGYLPEITGTTADGRPLTGSHNHAHWLPISLFGRGQIDHVLVYAPGKFSEYAIQAVSNIRWAYAKGIKRLSVNLVGEGTLPELINSLPAQHQHAFPHYGGQVFESVTPMVLRKYLSRGKKSVEGQIREELLERGFSEPESIEVWSDQRMVERSLKGHVLQRKKGKPQPRFARSWAATIRFATPQEVAPLSLGYASHFGLGMFRSI
ncbi:type I-G CRISPR-associated protein Csb2 [Rhodopirellula halodulae]|uniref:type I-G CRISPR-associated protein Csb2 n=1 Tax=Rhodopirellula halodulae TaxID=2894198 RepID=UPI001E4AECB2|nr:type I-U CRISPR-associated protein Csb2 [Rhodopirellula sp. JC737]MCC9656848.1 type I-U CRISPR-associated protein Csb2 [Rhodopirellula sp. JC737]